MTPEEAYVEALRRIHEAEETGAIVLDLRRVSELNRLPSELSRLTALQSLNLSGCGQLSVSLFSLVSLTSLQMLDLSACKQLDGDLSALAGLISLQSLKFFGCEQLSGDLSALASLSALQSLNLFGCRQLSGDLSALAGLASLRSLNLSGCERLSGDLSALADLTALQSLNLFGCRQLSGDLSALAGLAALRSLNLSGCERLSGDLSALAGLTTLQWLNLSGCLGIRRFAPLESLLPRLKYLSLFGCKLDDLLPEVCGRKWDENVVDKVRSYYHQRRDSDLETSHLKDFLVSYTAADRAWAEWIAWQLEDAGYQFKIQAWDLSPRGNFVVEMQKAILECKRTIAVFSPNYFSSEFTEAEWIAAFKLDPTGRNEKLIPVCIEACQPPGLLGSITYIDLVGFTEEAARQALLDGVKQGRAKPTRAPAFPGSARPRPVFPSAIPRTIHNREKDRVEAQQRERERLARLERERREVPAPASDASQAIDRVNFSVFAPCVICPAQQFLLDLWVHLPTQTDEVTSLTREFGRDRRLGIKPQVAVTHGAALSVVLDLPSLRIKDPLKRKSTSNFPLALVGTQFVSLLAGALGPK
jgi:hypothetical protein